MNISAIFIRRPVATTLLTLGVVLAGMLAFNLLPVSPLPQVDFPTISVSAGLPGADPETMATSVAAPLERQFGRIAGVTEMTSTSNRGSTSVTLQFDLSRDINGAARDVQAAINAARGYLPANLPSNPSYRKVNPSDAPIMIISLTSETVTKPKMYDAASSILAQKLSQVKGVGQVFVGGSSLPAVRIEMNPLALNRYGVSLENVRGAISSTTVNRPKGSVDDRDHTWELHSNDQLNTAAQYLPLVVSYRSGAAVRVQDIANVVDSVEDVRTTGIVNGKPAVMVVLFRQPGANIIETVDSVRDLLPQLKAALPGGIDLSVVLDRTPPIRGSLHDVEVTLLISAALVILVVFWFLRNVRATIIPAVAVGVSIIGTFAVMYLFGYSLDNLSLMALTIATGFVVDDAIVVLENTTRYRELGHSPLEAAFIGSREISFTVVSMSISLVAVFIPILLMGGMVGRLFREFAVTLSASIMVSLLVSLTLTPMMCAILLRPEEPREHGWLYRWSEGMFNRLHSGYERTLRIALDHQFIMLLVTFVTIGFNVYLFGAIPKGFFPEQDTGRIAGSIQAAQDTSYQAMRDKLTQIVNIIKTDPDIEYVTGFTGGGGGGGSTTNTARMFISLKPFSKRKANAQEIIRRLRGKINQVPGAPTFLQPVQDLRVGGRISNALYQYTLQGANIAELNSWAQQLMRKFRTMPQLVDVSSDQQDKGREATLVIDRATAARFGITPQVIDNTLYDAFGQRQVAITYTLLNQYHVVLEVDPAFWQRPDTLQDIYVPGTNNAMVPLSAFSHYEPTASALAVNHQSQFPSVTLSFNLAPGVALGQGVQAIEKATRDLGMPASIRGNFSGSAQAFQASLANEPFLILAALITVYIVLGVLYESYMHPLTILSTLPSAGVGAVLALMLFKTDLSLIAIIGVILLIGIVKKNGIMMVDFAIGAQRKEGRSAHDAIYEACLLRFRPIMMTTMAALLGAVPLALGTGVGSELRRPLGISIVGGLIFSQAMTLYTTPVVYLYMDRFREFIERVRGKSERRREYEESRAGLGEDDGDKG
ncbi:multidrug efflux RND transporter permease subunit [Geomesophilobacter sediminis]|uniref:Multidrug efflux RND transporter permease subunit n=1 Tax=Geomesophilobacter sediminis TaxID=2798584 RepID=A0A8J7LVR7_9BACT|nr:multidrug efflux RND transporter permease subunit [Geomesophilobacter sediminis]MBJ6725320.1 multidrug efflux RND transporter permease subunit [Geomesophilobacter sediminis]